MTDQSTFLYTDVLPLRRQPLRAAVQLFAWLLLHPTAWRNHLVRIAPGLPADFCLLGLPRLYWNNAKLQRLLLLLYLILPLLTVLLVTLTIVATGWLTSFAFFGWALGCIIGIVFGLLVSVAAGATVAVVAGALLAWIYGAPNLIMLDLFSGVRCGLLFAVISATAFYVTSTVTQRTLQRPLTREVGSFVLGFLASLLVAAGLIGVIVALVQARQANFITGSSGGPLIGSVTGILFSVVAGWRVRDWRSGLGCGLAVILITTLAFGNAGYEFAHNPSGRELLVAYSLVVTLIYFFLFLFPYVLAERIAGAWAGIIAGVLGGLALHPALRYLVDFYALAPQFALGAGITFLGITMPWWRPVLCYPLEVAWNTLLLRADEVGADQNRTLLPWHAAFWDELQFLPLYGLDDHLLLLMERNPAEGQVALEYISAGRQRWAARAAQIELDARRLEQCATVEEIAAVHNGLTAGDLAGPASAVLRRFSSASNDIAVGLTQISAYNQRLVLMAVEHELNALQLDLMRSTAPYAQRFQPIAHHWRQLVAQHVQHLAATAELHGEIQNPYVVGVPLTKHQEIFVGRADISARIEQLLQDTNHPPLLLYGQRRMGKTSLLYNLRWLLPNRIVPLLVDLQGPVALATDHAGFLYNIAKAIYTSAQQQQLTLTPLKREVLAADPFTVFDDWLDSVEAAAVAQGRATLLLALDEFEALDSALRKGRLSDEAVLGMLRHIIQHRERFKLLLAGSHTLDEFARWSSYLINAQMVHLSYLTELEARQLIERPIKAFALAYEPAASQRVLALTRGHPYLVQLLCGEIVMRKNEEPLRTRRYATVADVEAAVPIMLTRGRQFFADIALHQVNPVGLRVLQQLAKHGEGVAGSWESLLDTMNEPETLRQALTLLLRRELIEPIGSGYCFQVEVIRRWFAQSQ